MLGKWLGYIQTMCSKPAHSWQGPFFFSKVGPFYKKGPLGCFIINAYFFIIKKARPPSKGRIGKFWKVVNSGKWDIFS